MSLLSSYQRDEGKRLQVLLSQRMKEMKVDRAGKARRIHVLAQNNSGRFEHTFSTPNNVVDLVRGWLLSPDKPYTITITEGILHGVISSPHRTLKFREIAED